jgi:hypothetical protein
VRLSREGNLYYQRLITAGVVVETR